MFKLVDDMAVLPGVILEQFQQVIADVLSVSYRRGLCSGVFLVLCLQPNEDLAYVAAGQTACEFMAVLSFRT
jgi:hypothetical protein